MGKFFDKLCDRSTLESAWRHVLKKGSRGGLDGVQPSDLEKDIDKTLAGLIRDLRENRYVPVPYAKGAMPKFNEENEWRKLSLPSVLDKIVQQAFKDAVNPVFEEDFLDCSYAYRTGKGPIKAIRRVEHTLHSHSVPWVATMDIDDFFDTMNHKILVNEITRKVNEPEILNLVSLWLHAGVISNKGAWEEPDEGVAQGSVVSPLFSNIYLHPLDCFAINKNLHYIRYSDNFILLSEKKDDIYIAYEQIQSFIVDRLKLSLNKNPYPFKNVNRGFAFLGIYVKGDLRRISAAKETKIFRKLNWVTDKTRQGNTESFLKRMNERVESTARYYSFIKPVEQFAAFDQHLLKRLRFLLMDFLGKGMLSSKNDILEFLEKVSFFTERDDSKRNALCRALAEDVLGAVYGKKDRDVSDAPKSKAAQAKRTAAQKTRFLRKVSDQSELVISTPGIFIGKTGARIVVREQRKNVLEMPFSKVRNVAINTSGVSLSSDVIFQCTRNKIPITFYSFKGMPHAVLQAPIHSMGTVSVLQIKAYETEKALSLVKKFQTGKSKNQMNLLKFYLRSRKKSQPEFANQVNENLKIMQVVLSELQGIQSKSAFSVCRDRIFSAEGRTSALYWDCMKLLVSPELGFEKRERFKASDLVNSMLNYGYGILYQRVWQAVLKAGLNPHISFLHAFQQNKPTLVYDLVEEFRQPFIDRPVFSLCTKGRRGSDLKLEKTTGLLTKETKDQVVKAVLNRLAALTSFRSKKIKCEDILEIQTRNVVAYLEDKGAYKPFIAGY